MLRRATGLQHRLGRDRETLELMKQLRKDYTVYEAWQSFPNDTVFEIIEKACAARE